MSMNPDTRITEAQHESPNKARVEAELRELQDKHRLAYHTTETYPYQFANVADRLLEADFCYHYGTVPTLEYLQRNDALSATDFTAQVAALKPNRGQSLPLFSMTLLPSKTAIYPYDTSSNSISMSGYLFTLDESLSPQAARVVGRVPDYKASGGIFEKIGVDRALLKEDWPQKTDALLKQIASEYTSPKDVFELNEILVAAGQRHIKALAIPLRYEHVTEETPYFLKQAQLWGALEGLTHLRLGLDVPVVYYHASGKSAGECTYLAQGRRELLAKALEIIDQLDADQKLQSLIASPVPGDVDHIRYKMKMELGLDVEKPMYAQRAVIERLRDECNQSPAVGVKR